MDVKDAMRQLLNRYKKQLQENMHKVSKENVYKVSKHILLFGMCTLPDAVCFNLWSCAQL